MGWGYLDTYLWRFWLCRHHEPQSSQRAHPSLLGCAGRCCRSFSPGRKQVSVRSCPYLLLWVPVLIMLPGSVNLMLEYLLYVHLLVIPCSAQPVNTPELLCLGFLPPSSLSLPLGRILPNTNQVIQSLLKAITCPNHSRAKYLTTRDNPVPQRPPKLFKPANPKPAYQVLPVLSYRNHSKNSCLQFPIFLCLLTNPRASPCGVTCPLLLEIVLNYLLNGHHFSIPGLTIPEISY